MNILNKLASAFVEHIFLAKSESTKPHISKFGSAIIIL